MSAVRRVVTEETITIDELATELDCSSRTIRDEMKRAKTKLRFFKIGREYQIYLWSAQEWVDSRTRGGLRR